VQPERARAACALAAITAAAAIVLGTAEAAAQAPSRAVVEVLPNLLELDGGSGEIEVRVAGAPSLSVASAWLYFDASVVALTSVTPGEWVTDRGGRLRHEVSGGYLTLRAELPPDADILATAGAEDGQGRGGNGGTEDDGGDARTDSGLAGQDSLGDLAPGGVIARITFAPIASGSTEIEVDGAELRDLEDTEVESETGPAARIDVLAEPDEELVAAASAQATALAEGSSTGGMAGALVSDAASAVRRGVRGLGPLALWLGILVSATAVTALAWWLGREPSADARSRAGRETAGHRTPR